MKLQNLKSVPQYHINRNQIITRLHTTHFDVFGNPKMPTS